MSDFFANVCPKNGEYVRWEIKKKNEHSLKANVEVHVLGLKRYWST